MDNNSSPNFFGLGRQLVNVLSALDIQHAVPVWTLKQTKNKIFLDISWNKQVFKFPAESDGNKGTRSAQPSSLVSRLSGRGRQENKPAPKSASKQESQLLDSNKVKGTGLKVHRRRKPPSVRKRDKERYEKWKENRKQNSISQNISKPTSPRLTAPSEKAITQSTENPIQNRSDIIEPKTLESEVDSELYHVNAQDILPASTASQPISCLTRRCQPIPVGEIGFELVKQEQARNNSQREQDTPSPIVQQGSFPLYESDEVELEANRKIASRAILDQSALENPSGISYPKVNQNIPPLTPLHLQKIESKADEAYDSIEQYLYGDSDFDPEITLDSPIKVCCNFVCMLSETEVPGGLKRCSRCKFVHYCSRNCQKEHWKVHRTACGKLF